MRLKEDDLDYWFMQDPDLLTYWVDLSGCENIRLPFEEKKRMIDKYGLSVEDVLNMYYNYPLVIPLFEDLA